MVDNKTKSALATTIAALSAIGALNWGLIGALDFNLVQTIFGNIPAAEKVIYILVGVAGLLGLKELLTSREAH